MRSTRVVAPTEECSEAVWESIQHGEVESSLLGFKHESKNQKSLNLFFSSVILNYEIVWGISFIARKWILLTVFVVWAVVISFVIYKNWVPPQKAHEFYDFPQEVIHLDHMAKLPKWLGEFLKWLWLGLAQWGSWVVFERTDWWWWVVNCSHI